jgi:hypothetical protein
MRTVRYIRARDRPLPGAPWQETDYAAQLRLFDVRRREEAVVQRCTTGQKKLYSSVWQGLASDAPGGRQRESKVGRTVDA